MQFSAVLELIAKSWLISCLEVTAIVSHPLSNQISYSVELLMPRDRIPILTDSILRP